MKRIIRLFFLAFSIVALNGMAISCSVGKEIVKLPLLSCQIKLLIPKNEFIIKSENYEEGVFYTFTSRKGAYIVVFEGALMQFLPEDTLSESQIRKYNDKTIFTGITDNFYWRKDSIKGVRLFYNRVTSDSRKCFDKILNSAKIRIGGNSK